MKKLARFLGAFLLLFAGHLAMAQQEEVEMADVMRSNGKIYVVVAIVMIVLAGLIFFLFALDGRIKRLEQQLGDKK